MRTQLNDSQTALLAAAREPWSGQAVEVVRITGPRSAVANLARAAVAQSKLLGSGPRHLRVAALSQWDAEMSLVQLAGPGSRGSGHLDNVYRCLARLAGEDKRPLVLWLDYAGRMSRSDQDAFTALVEWVADNLGIATRLIYCMQQVLIYSSAERRWGRGIRINTALEAEARVWNIGSRDGNELLGARGAESGASEERAVKIA
jgi:hypothetical protein